MYLLYKEEIKTSKDYYYLYNCHCLYSLHYNIHISSYLNKQNISLLRNKSYNPISVLTLSLNQ